MALQWLKQSLVSLSEIRLLLKGRSLDLAIPPPSR
jgi:hypothetical protein